MAKKSFISLELADFLSGYLEFNGGDIHQHQHVNTVGDVQVRSTEKNHDLSNPGFLSEKFNDLWPKEINNQVSELDDLSDNDVFYNNDKQIEKELVTKEDEREQFNNKHEKEQDRNEEEKEQDENEQEKEQDENDYEQEQNQNEQE